MIVFVAKTGVILFFRNCCGDMINYYLYCAFSCKLRSSESTENNVGKLDLVFQGADLN